MASRRPRSRVTPAGLPDSRSRRRGRWQVRGRLLDLEQVTPPPSPGSCALAHVLISACRVAAGYQLVPRALRDRLGDIDHDHADFPGPSVPSVATAKAARP